MTHTHTHKIANVKSEDFPDRLLDCKLIHKDCFIALVVLFTVRMQMLEVGGWRLCSVKFKDRTYEIWVENLEDNKSVRTI